MSVERSDRPRGVTPNVGRHGRRPKSHLDFWGDRQLRYEMELEPQRFWDPTRPGELPAVGRALVVALAGRI